MAAMWCSCTENSRSLFARWPIHFFITSIRWSSESSSRMTAVCAWGHHRSSPKPIWIFKLFSPTRNLFSAASLRAPLCSHEWDRNRAVGWEAAADDQEYLYLCGHRQVSFPYEQKEKKMQSLCGAVLPHVSLNKVVLVIVNLLSI